MSTAYGLISDENGLSAANKLLLHQCRMVIGPYLCYYYAPKSDVNLSDQGMSRMENGTNKSAFQEQRSDFRDAQLREAENATENLIEFLEDNSSSYPEWLSSTAFSSYRKLFIKTGREFDEYFSSHSPFRNYIAMRSKMVDVEDDIREKIGDDLFEYLKGKDLVEDPSFTTKETTLLYRLKKAIAYLTVSFAGEFLNVRIDANGLTIMDSQRSARDADAKRTNADAMAISNLTGTAADTGRNWLKKAMKYLADNATDFPSWAAPVKPGDEPSVNEGLNGVFAMC